MHDAYPRSLHRFRDVGYVVWGVLWAVVLFAGLLGQAGTARPVVLAEADTLPCCAGCHCAAHACVDSSGGGRPSCWAAHLFGGGAWRLSAARGCALPCGSNDCIMCLLVCCHVHACVGTSDGCVFARVYHFHQPPSSTIGSDVQFVGASGVNRQLADYTGPVPFLASADTLILAGFDGPRLFMLIPAFSNCSQAASTGFSFASCVDDGVDGESSSGSSSSVIFATHTTTMRTIIRSCQPSLHLCCGACDLFGHPQDRRQACIKVWLCYRRCEVGCASARLPVVLNSGTPRRAHEHALFVQMKCVLAWLCSCFRMDDVCTWRVHICCFAFCVGSHQLVVANSGTPRRTQGFGDWTGPHLWLNYRIGEALHPGPLHSIVSANLTSLRAHVVDLKGIRDECLLMQEVHASEEQCDRVTTLHLGVYS